MRRQFGTRRNGYRQTGRLRLTLQGLQTFVVELQICTDVRQGRFNFQLLQGGLRGRIGRQHLQRLYFKTVLVFGRKRLNPRTKPPVGQEQILNMGAEFFYLNMLNIEAAVPSQRLGLIVIGQMAVVYTQMQNTHRLGGGVLIKGGQAAQQNFKVRQTVARAFNHVELRAQ